MIPKYYIIMNLNLFWHNAAKVKNSDLYIQILIVINQDKDLDQLFETGNNEYTLFYIRLTEEFDFHMKFSVEKEDNNE